MNKKYIGIISCVLIGLILLELTIVLIVFFRINNQETNEIKNRMSEINDNLISRITTVFKLIAHNLNRNVAFMRQNGIYIPKKNFTDLIQFDNLPIKNSVESYYWIARVPFDELETFNEFCDEYVKSGCRISEVEIINDTITIIPVQNRTDYMPYVYGNPPLTIEDSLVGFDFQSLAIFEPLLDQLRVSTNITGSRKISLTRPIETNPFSYGILVSRGAYINETYPDPYDVFGYFTAIVNIHDIMNYAISEISLDVSREDIDLFVFDVTEGDEFISEKANNLSLLYRENKSEYYDIWFLEDIINSPIIDEFTILDSLEIFNRKWNIYFKFDLDYVKRIQQNQSVIVTISLSIICILIDFLTITMIAIYFVNKDKIKYEEEKNEISNKMLKYVSHEVRNPLNIIKTLVSYVLDTLNDYLNEGEKTNNNSASKSKDKSIEESSLSSQSLSSNFNIKKLLRDKIVLEVDMIKSAISDLHTALNSCDLIEHIVKDLLDIKKLEAGKLDLDNKNHKIDHIIYDMKKTFMQIIEEKGTVNFSIEVDENIKTIYIDKHRLKQILLNYISNAIKFTEKGSIKLKIFHHNEKLRFRVDDSGRGIKEEDKKKIFTPFAQTDLLDASRHNGNGLGLHLCSMLSKRMNSVVGFDSKFGKGSSFWIDFDSGIINLENDIDSEESDDIV